ncbi:MAG: gamma-glutamyltransferase [Sphingomonas sp.]|uniref:gamma-glutamyltransferase n=1 Tax=Sphingomonas sp. TaxID=28214 RepID=UPI0025FAC021|nr:gamma-glutamyltransferase [Sphingomonas sp.]MBY0284537.1 gamma-glutamyltransferase [Sphingomonas sp.]
MRITLIALTALLLSPTPALAHPPKPKPAASARGIVSAADPRAAEAGRDILRAGGSAADAEMAMMLALTVVEPQSSGIGGGGFFVYQQAGGKLVTIDGREKAPAAATPKRFLTPDGKPMPFFQAVPGGLSVGVPGNIRLMAMVHQRFGKLPWKALFAPAIKLAEEGYTVTKPMAAGMGYVSQVWSAFPAISAQYTRDGKPLTEGALVKNPDLAKTLRLIADKGADAFYTGANAQAIVTAATTAQRNPSDITLADLAAYQAKERPPICGSYRGYKICGMGPPSSGAVTVLQILGMLERFDMKKLGASNPVSWHLIGEAMLLAYADREKYLADSDFVPIPLKGMTDKAYLKSRSMLLSPDKALGTYEAGTPPGAEPRTAAISSEVAGTTHFVAVDRAGNVGTMTSTVEGPFGSQILAGGFVLNNELTDFTFAPEKNGAPVANRVEGNKRPLSSMSPTIVYDTKGHPVFTVGAAGGKTIIMQVAKALIAHLDWGMNARDAIGHGLVYFNGTTLILEQGTALEPMKPAIEALGHKVSVAKLGLKANAAERTPKGWVGAADPRSVGVALTE